MVGVSGSDEFCKERRLIVGGRQREGIWRVIGTIFGGIFFVEVLWFKETWEKSPT